MAHSYSHLYGLNTVGLRFFTVYGPWGRPDMAYYMFCDKIVKEQPISVFNNGKVYRDFTYIDDIIKGTMAAIKNPIDCKIFNLGNNSSINIMDMISLLEDHLGKKALVNFKGLESGDLVKTYADIEYTRLKLGYSPTISLNEGIPKFIDWYKSYNTIK